MNMHQITRITLINCRNDLHSRLITHSQNRCHSQDIFFPSIGHPSTREDSKDLHRPLSIWVQGPRFEHGARPMANLREAADFLGWLAYIPIDKKHIRSTQLPKVSHHDASKSPIRCWTPFLTIQSQDLPPQKKSPRLKPRPFPQPFTVRSIQ